MGLFSKFKREIQQKGDKAVLALSHSTRLKRDVAAVGNVVAASSALPTHGVSLFAGIYSIPRYLWCWKKHRIVQESLKHRGLHIPDRTKRDYIIPATVGVVTGSLGAGADALTGLADGVVPHKVDAAHAIPIDQWLDHAGQSAEDTATNHAKALANPEFAKDLVERGWGAAYDSDDLGQHIQNGVQHLATVGNTVALDGTPMLSHKTADVAGQTLVAVMVGEAVGKGIEATSPRRGVAKHDQ